MSPSHWLWHSPWAHALLIFRMLPMSSCLISPETILDTLLSFILDQIPAVTSSSLHLFAMVITRLFASTWVQCHDWFILQYYISQSPAMKIILKPQSGLSMSEILQSSAPHFHYISKVIVETQYSCLLMSADVCSSHDTFIDMFFQGMDAVQYISNIHSCCTLVLTPDRKWMIKAWNSSKQDG